MGHLHNCITAGPNLLISCPQVGAPEVFGCPSSPLSISRILSQLRVQIEFRLLNRPPVIPGRIETSVGADLAILRSEEHTSELQSRGHLVCRLLLEKKKMTTK